MPLTSSWATLRWRRWKASYNHTNNGEMRGAIIGSEAACPTRKVAKTAPANRALKHYLIYFQQRALCTSAPRQPPFKTSHFFNSRLIRNCDGWPAFARKRLWRCRVDFKQQVESHWLHMVGRSWWQHGEFTPPVCIVKLLIVANRPLRPIFDPAPL